MWGWEEGKQRFLYGGLCCVCTATQEGPADVGILVGQHSTAVHKPEEAH